MTRIRLGQVDYINCLPVYHSLEEGPLPLDLELVRGTPSALNKLFFAGQLDCTPLSSIEYARNRDRCVIVPGLCIAAGGRVASILLFSRLPVTELEGKTVALTTSSATSVAMLRILLEHYFHVDVHYVSEAPELGTMLSRAEAALLIGDDALRAHIGVRTSPGGVIVTDLGETWKQFTGDPFVYALWVVRSAFAVEHPRLTGRLAASLKEARETGAADLAVVRAKAVKRTGLPDDVVEDYFRTIKLDFDPIYRRALTNFYDWAYKSGLTEERVRLD